MDNLLICPKCNYQNLPQTRFCDQCGKHLFEVSSARSLALVEGTAGIGKSTLVNNMLAHQMGQNLRLNTLLRMGQGHTYGPLRPDEIDSPLSAEDHLSYLSRIYETLSFLSYPTEPAVTVPFMGVIETLHLTLGVRPGLLSMEQVLDFDKKLAAIGCKLIFIKVGPQTLWERCIWERRRMALLPSTARNMGVLSKRFIITTLREQQRMLDLFEQSALKKLLIDGETSPELATEEAYRFWVS